MKLKNASGVMVLTAALWVFFSLTVYAKMEKESNNRPEEANLIRSGETVEGLLQNGHDDFAITLLSAGKTTKNSSNEGSSPLDGYAMKRLHENKFGFSFELPDYWIWELLPDKSGYLLSGPAGTEENEVIIIVQAIKKSANPGSSLAKQLQEARAQIEGVAGAEIRSEDVVTVSGRQVPFFLALYPGQTAKQEPATFAHVQLVVENEPYYFWISYAAPTQYFEKYQEIFANMLTTFQIATAREQSPGAAPATSQTTRGRITVQSFNAGSGSMSAPRVIVKARGFGSGAKRLKLFAVSADGSLKELQSVACTDGSTVDFNAAYNLKDTQFFELRLYDAQEAMMASIKHPESSR